MFAAMDSTVNSFYLTDRGFQPLCHRIRETSVCPTHGTVFQKNPSQLVSRPKHVIALATVRHATNRKISVEQTMSAIAPDMVGVGAVC